MVRPKPGTVLGKIAEEVQLALAEKAESGAAGHASARALDRGEGWIANDVMCTAGPGDRAFEEQHTRVSIAMVVAGTFEYRTALGRHLMTPGALFLGWPGWSFECGHDHAAGDRCIAFHYTPEYVERLEGELNGSVKGGFRVPRVPPSRDSAAVVARVCAGLATGAEVAWEEIAVELAAISIRSADGSDRREVRPSPAATLSVTEGIRMIEADPGAPFTLHELASHAGLSPYHYLRTFRRIAGVTPHQFVLRTRLREAASRLLGSDSRVITTAFDAGFGDVSNSNHAFRAEFGVTPLQFRTRFGSQEPVRSQPP